MPSMIRSARPYSLGPEATLLQQAVTRFDWVDLRGFAPHANAREAGQATSAITLSIWHSRQRFCPTCGAAVRPALAGWAQRCTNEADGNRVLFPRVEPAVITAIVDGHDRLLLQHNAAWKDSSCIRCPPDLWRRGRTLNTPAAARPWKRPASSSARYGTWLAAVAVPGFADDGVQAHAITTTCMWMARRP